MSRGREPVLIRRDKPTRNEREYGTFYSAIVTSVRGDGRVSVRIPDLGVTMGPIMPINTGANNHLSKGDTVICTFTDSSNSSLVIFGSISKITDPYTTATTTQALIDSLSSSVSASVSSVSASVSSLSANTDTSFRDEKIKLLMEVW
jgi:hypothetical protein